jgi:hypothetical protein
VPERLRDLLADVAAMLLGVAAFFAFCGWWVLLPDNIAWLDHGDRAMHQLGWMFFRDAPWGWPPGRSPALGLELSSSIALVDGLPLLALPFKLIEHWLPRPFQYFGFWLLASFALQALFAARIARELGTGRAMALVAAGFALLTPAFLFRVPLHLALSGHWVVLAALYLHVRRAPPAPWMWPLLAGLTAAIHATLLAMVLALWSAAWLQRLLLKRLSMARAVGEPALVAAVTLGVLWAVGFFGTMSYGTYGYGSYKLNLLWPVLRYGWSQLVPDWPHGRFDYEGLSFLGIGIFMLLALAVLSGAVLRLRVLLTRRWLPLVVTALALMGFAFSRVLSLGATDILEIDMPRFVDSLGSAFRSTGRFVWPLLYLISIGTVVLVARRLPRAALPLALLALLAQAVDSAPAWRLFAASQPKPAATWASPLVSPLWERAVAAGYDRIRAIPARLMNPDWRALGYFAVTHGMATDAVYLGRVDARALHALRVRNTAMLASGAFEPRTLYVLDVPSALHILPVAGPDDLLAIVDGRIVFARGGARLAEGLGLGGGGSWLPAVAYGGSRTD